MQWRVTNSANVVLDHRLLLNLEIQFLVTAHTQLRFGTLKASGLKDIVDTNSYIY